MQSYKIVMLRYDNRNTGNIPSWTPDMECAGNTGTFYLVPIYTNGRILFPLAEYIYLVKEEISHENLYQLQIPTNAFITLDDQGNAKYEEVVNLCPMTYGSFAEWLQFQVTKSLDYFIDSYYIDGEGFKHTLEENSHYTTINMQSTWGATCIYLSKINFNPPSHRNDYYQKAYEIAFNYLYGYPVTCEGVPYGTGEYVFQTQSNNSYIWKTTAWQPLEGDLCSSYCLTEDISHGIVDLFFPLTEIKTNFLNAFTDDNMISFKNTFTKNIFAGYDDNGNILFNSQVDGGNYFQNDAGCATLEINYLQQAVLGWMPLWKWDEENENPQLFDLIMEEYKLLKHYPAFNGAHYYGLSEVVNAQWGKECPDLTLYNRQLIYDQNFFSKNILTIDPSKINNWNSDNYESFANPVITDKTFTIESGVTSNMSATNKLVFKHGFKAKSGSHFHAFTDPSLCMNNKSMVAITPDEIPDDAPNYQKPEIKSKPVVEVNEQTKFSIYPNPGKGLFTISLSGFEDKNMILVISNTYGQQITQLPLKLLPTQQIDLSYFTAGIYYLSIINNTEIKNEILIIQ